MLFLHGAGNRPLLFNTPYFVTFGEGPFIMLYARSVNDRDIDDFRRTSAQFGLPYLRQ